MFVDGKPAGQSPLVLRLEAGRHTIEARLDGYRVLRRKVRVAAGAKQSLVLRLRKRR